MVKTNTGARACHSCASPEQPDAVCLFSHFSCYLLYTHLFDLAFPPTDTGMPADSLTLWNYFFDFAIELQFGCHPTGSAFAGDNGAINILLID